MSSKFYIVFDGPPSPEGARFIEVEDESGESVGPEQTGAEWSVRDNYWTLGPFSAERTQEAAE